MAESVDALTEAVVALGVQWRHAGADASSMTDAGLLDLNRRFSQARRLLDAALLPIASELARRSRPELGSAGLSRKAGHRTPAQLIAASSGVHPGDAQRLLQVAEATRAQTTLTGEAAPAVHPHVARAVAQGAIGVPAASAIVAALDRMAMRGDATVRDSAEETLVSHAQSLPLADLLAVLRRAEAHLDPDGLVPAVRAQRADRFLKIAHDRDGMTCLTARLDAETAAPVVAAIEALVTHQLRVSRGRNTPGGLAVDGTLAAADAAVAVERSGEFDRKAAESPVGDAAASAGALSVAPETRSLAQLRADALVAICAHALRADPDALPGAGGTTVVVRMTLDDLRSGVGLATIDGMEQPVDAGTARRMAARAEIIPCVLGTDSEVLDWGRARRHFTRAQRLALVERDGGCAFCHLPPAFTEAHHLRWWTRDAGTTDLDNGILLCTACHHRVHDDGWEIRIDRADGSPPGGGMVWFIPPPHIDPARTPRMGGRRRFDPLLWNLAA